MKEQKDKLSQFVGFSISNNMKNRIEKVFIAPDFLFKSYADCERAIFECGLLSYEEEFKIRDIMATNGEEQLNTFEMEKFKNKIVVVVSNW